ncbi:3-keto-steroid reductase, variant 2 [Orbilia ellipsospora]
MVSVMSAATELQNRYPRIHHVFCNAAVIPFTRIDWLKAIRQFATGFVDAMTVPRYKVQNIGWLTDSHQALLRPQSPSTKKSTLSELGAAFTANVFGHYFLLHEIMQTLHSPMSSQDEPSRIIWIGSIESDPLTFNIEDVQGIKSTKPYESSKTLTDILVLGSQLPETEKYFRSYTTPPQDRAPNFQLQKTKPPVFLIAHPGIISTEIVALPWWQSRAKIIGFLFCKFLGSPWHCIDPFIGANAPVWLALSPHLEMVKGFKWGSGCNWKNGEFVLETRVDADVTSHASRLWGQMEDLRILWKSLLVPQP